MRVVDIRQDQAAGLAELKQELIAAGFADVSFRNEAPRSLDEMITDLRKVGEGFRKRGIAGSD